jgi:hypothetical protein
MISVEVEKWTRDYMAKAIPLSSTLCIAIVKIVKYLRRKRFNLMLERFSMENRRIGKICNKAIKIGRSENRFEEKRSWGVEL